MPDIIASLKRFEASLSDEERQAMTAETQNLLSRSKGAITMKIASTSKQARQCVKCGGHIGAQDPDDICETCKLKRRAQMPLAGTPPSGNVPPVTAEPDPSKPDPMMQAPVAQAATPPPAPVMPPPPVTAEPEPDAIGEYIDEQELDKSNLTDNEMGLKEPVPTKTAAYVEAYGNLRIRPTAQKTLEVFDPTNGLAIMHVRPNLKTRSDPNMLRKCAVEVLANIAHEGLAKTAQRFRAQLKQAGGVVDYGDTSMQKNLNIDKNSLEDDADSNMKQKVEPDVSSTTNTVSTTMADAPAKRQPEGLSGKAAQISSGSGALDGHETNMADKPQESPTGNALTSLENSGDNMTDVRNMKDKGDDSALDDVITTFANETLTAGRRQVGAQSAPMVTPMEVKESGCGGFETPKKSDADSGAPCGTPPNTHFWNKVGWDPENPRWTCIHCGAIVDGAEKPSETDTGRQAQAPAPPPPAAPTPPPAPVTAEPDPDPAPVGLDPEKMTPEQKLAHLYRKRAEKEVAQKTREFVAKFTRCVRMAARRQALNLEPNNLKIAIADSLMSEGALSKHETYVPMDARTATYTIERGLDQKASLAFVDSLLHRAAAFMRMGAEALTQVEEDLDKIQPVAPPMKEEAQGSNSPSVMPKMPQMAQDPAMQPPPPMPQMSEPDPGMQQMDEAGPEMGPPQMDMQPAIEEQQERAASRRQAAWQGNLPINPSAVTPPQPQNDKRNAIRFAVGGTKSAALHSFLNR